MRSRCALLFVLMHIAGFSGAATAQNVDQQLCLAPDPDLSISRCTAMIQSGHETPAKPSRGLRQAGLRLQPQAPMGPRHSGLRPGHPAQPEFR